MSGNIAVDPDKLEQLANDVVTELTDMENKYKDLHVELGQMILQCDPRYSGCFSRWAMRGAQERRSSPS